jgi:hypothetical protein
MRGVLGALLLLLLVALEGGSNAAKLKIPIGTIFSKAPDWQDVFDAMNLAMEGHTTAAAANNATAATAAAANTDFDMKFYVDNIDTVDAYKLTKIICRQVWWCLVLVRITSFKG